MGEGGDFGLLLDIHGRYFTFFGTMRYNLMNIRLLLGKGDIFLSEMTVSNQTFSEGDGVPKYSYQLVVQRGPRPGEIFSLNQSMLILGRDPMSDIVVNDPEISRNHARLTYTTEGYEIQDMGSTNGTYVNGRRLRGEPMLLEPDVDVILGSNVTLSYEVHEVESELLETVLSNTDEYREEDTPADGAGTILAADGDDAYWGGDESEGMSVEEFEAEAFPPAPAPLVEEKPAEARPTYSSPPQAAPPPMTAAPPSTAIPEGVNDGEPSKKRRNFILIGAGVGVFLCCCLLGLIVLIAYIAQTQGILEEFLFAGFSEIAMVGLGLLL